MSGWGPWVPHGFAPRYHLTAHRRLRGLYVVFVSASDAFDRRVHFEARHDRRSLLRIKASTWADAKCAAIAFLNELTPPEAGIAAEFEQLVEPGGKP